jgi:hypothetical protein
VKFVTGSSSSSSSNNLNKYEKQLTKKQTQFRQAALFFLNMQTRYRGEEKQF